MNTNSDLVSIVVTVFNVAPYLDECISSLLAQSYTNIEIILVNDGSTDDSGKICESYKKRDKRITVLQQPHKGFGPTSNSGIDRAKGKYLMFCDGDDLYFPTSVERMVMAVKRTKVNIAHASGLAFDNVTGSILDEVFINTVPIPHINAEDILTRKDIIKYFPLISVYCWVNIINLKWLRRHRIRWPDVSLGYVDNAFLCNLMIHVNRLAIVREQICLHRMNRIGSDMYKVKIGEMYLALKISESIVKKQYPQLLGGFYKTFLCDLFGYWQQDAMVMKKIKKTALSVLKSKISIDSETERVCQEILKHTPLRTLIKKWIKFFIPFGIVQKIYT
jgi:glycosyltransferase involved in cell wall biosynthesis